jgi:hypothetical protein
MFWLKILSGIAGTLPQKDLGIILVVTLWNVQEVAPF